jgi:hypothetical protein
LLIAVIGKRILLGLLCLHAGGLFAEPFPNLDFERANTNNISYANGIGSGLVADLLPGWQLLFNGIPQTSVQFDPNPQGLGSGSYDAPSLVVIANPPPPFYEVYGGIFWLEINARPSETFSLITRGDVPVWATRMAARGFTSPGAAIGSKWSMNNEQLVYGGDLGLDISRFAGQNVEFRMDLSSGDLMPGPQRLGEVYFIPEPGSLFLLAFASPFFLHRKIRTTMSQFAGAVRQRCRSSTSSVRKVTHN